MHEEIVIVLIKSVLTRSGRNFIGVQSLYLSYFGQVQNYLEIENKPEKGDNLIR